jgi:hypothetical protein
VSTSVTIGEEDADAIVGAVERVPGVEHLDARHGALHLPARRVPGLRRRGDRLEVHVVVRPVRPLPRIADDVAAAVAELVAMPVDVVIEDVVDESLGRTVLDLREGKRDARRGA